MLTLSIYYKVISVNSCFPCPTFASSKVIHLGASAFHSFWGIIDLWKYIGKPFLYFYCFKSPSIQYMLDYSQHTVSTKLLFFSLSTADLDMLIHYQFISVGSKLNFFSILGANVLSWIQVSLAFGCLNALCLVLVCPFVKRLDCLINPK